MNFPGQIPQVDVGEILCGISIVEHMPLLEMVRVSCGAQVMIIFLRCSWESPFKCLQLNHPWRVYLHWSLVYLRHGVTVREGSAGFEASIVVQMDKLHMWYWHRVLECWIKSWLFFLWTSFLLMYLGRYKVVQILGPIPSMVESLAWPNSHCVWLYEEWTSRWKIFSPAPFAVTCPSNFQIYNLLLKQNEMPGDCRLMA